MSELLPPLLVASAVGAAVAGGVFFAFSGFVMQGLDRLPPADAARAMRAINVTAVRAPLMLELFGTALLAVIVVVLAVLQDAEEAWWACAGSAVYLITVIGVTVAANVPRNNTLAAANDSSAALTDAWREFRPGWTAWNHVRTAGGLAAAVLFLIAAVTG